MFEVYTYFGRVLRRFHIGDSETHHQAMEQARMFIKGYTGKAWCRLKF
jgi:hypothetical protein